MILPTDKSSLCVVLHRVRKSRLMRLTSERSEKGLVSNGYIADVPLVAAEIIDMINTRAIKEKDTIVSISSSSILYKELMLPKPRKLSNTAAIEAMIGSNMGISGDYNISYTIVGETVDENKNPLIKVLATACPQRLVDGYVKLFTHMGLRSRL